MFCTRMALLFALVLAFTNSCSLKVARTNSRIINSSSSENTAGSGSLAIEDLVINDIMLALIKDAGLTRTQASALAQGALALIDEAGRGTSLWSKTKFFLTGSSGFDRSDISQVAPVIISGMFGAMSSAGASIADDATKITVAQLATRTMFTSINDKITELPEETRLSLPGAIANKAVGSLDNAGVSSEMMGEGIGSVVKESTAGLISAGFTKDELTSAAKQVAEGGMNGLADTGMNAETMSGAASNLMSSAVSGLGALKDGGMIDASEISQMVGPMMQSAVGTLGSLSLGSAGDMQSLIGNMMSGAVGGLSGAGVSSMEDVKSAVGNCTQSALNGLSDAGVGLSEMTSMLGSVMQGAIGALSSAGVTSAADFEDLSSSIASSAISAAVTLVMAGDSSTGTVSSADLIGLVSKNVASGTMNALGDLSSGGFISSAQMMAATTAVTQQATATLVTASENLNFTFSAAIVSSFSEGMVSGLAKSGVSATTLAQASSNISDGIGAALEASGNTSINVAELQQAATSSANDWVSAMKLNCEQAGGTWNLSLQTCDYSKVVPVAVVETDATPPTPPSMVGFSSAFTSSSQVALYWTASEDKFFLTHNVRLCSNVDCKTGCLSTVSTAGITSNIESVPSGTYYGCVRGIDTSGNHSDWTASVGSITVDVTAPSAVTSVTFGASITKTTSLVLSWAGGDDAHFYRYEIKSCSDSACSTDCTETTSSTTSVGLTGVDGHSYYGCVRSVDLAGNASAWVVTPQPLEVDTTPPQTPTIVINGGNAYSTNSVVTLTLAASGASHMYITNTADCATNGSWQNYGTSASWTLGQVNTTATVYVKFKDLAGNESSCISDTIIHGNAAPGVPTMSAGASVTNDTTPTWSWSAPSNATRYSYTLSSGGSSLVSAIITTTSYTPDSAMADGTYTLCVSAGDQANNWSDASAACKTIAVDTLPPATPTISGATPTNNTQPRWSWTAVAEASHYWYKLDSSDFSTGSTDTAATTYIPPSSLSEGTHTLYVKAGDMAGNWSSIVSYPISIDLTAPGSPTLGNAQATNDNTPQWTWSTVSAATRYRYIIQHNSVTSTLSSDTTNTWYTPSTALEDGVHTLCVQAGDAAGNWSNIASACQTMTIDTVAPEAPTLAGNSPTNDTTPQWTWGAVTSATYYSYSFDGSGYSAPAAILQFTVPNPIAAGTHTLMVKAGDDAGNWSTPATSSILVDTTAPDSPNLTGDALIAHRNLVWIWPDISGSTYFCNLNGPSFPGSSPCSGGTTPTHSYTYPASTDGIYTLYVWARDDVSNNVSGVASYVTSVDTMPPVATISTIGTTASQLTGVAVGGTGVVAYKYKIGRQSTVDCSLASGYTQQSVGTAIADTLAEYTVNSALRLCVIGMDSAGNWQDTASATYLDWLKSCPSGQYYQDQTVGCVYTEVGKYSLDGISASPCNNKPLNSIYTSGRVTASSCPFFCDANYTLSSGQCLQFACSPGHINYPTCNPVGYEFYSSDGISSSRCINKPTNSIYTSATATSSICPWACNIGLMRNGSSCQSIDLSASTTSPATTTGSASIGSDDDYRILTLPFPFRFLGISYNQVYFDTNSFITFAAAPMGTNLAQDGIAFASSDQRAFAWDFTYGLLSSGIQYYRIHYISHHYSDSTYSAAQEVYAYMLSNQTIIVQINALEAGFSHSRGVIPSTGLTSVPSGFMSYTIVDTSANQDGTSWGIY